MLKKLIIIILSLFIINKVYALEEDILNIEAKSAIMIEATTGEILYSKNINEKMPPASMTKMMSMLLIMEEIEKGNLKWDEKITASDNASSMGGSQIFLKAGEVMTVTDLLKGIAIASGNDATVAMAERIAGTEDNFVKMMNDKANVLGLKNTNFVTSTGLDANNHYSTAYDMSIIARELIKHDKILKFTSTYEDYLRKDSKSPFWLVNTNRLVKYYSGLDGLKTGYTSSAGFCLTSTAKRDGMRLITVVMNEKDTKTRNKETIKLLDYGFNNYMVKNIINNKSVIGEKNIILGNKLKAQIIPKDNITILSKKSEKQRNINYKLEAEDIMAPVKKGDKIGTINIYEDNKIISKVDATVTENIEKANIFTIYFRNLFKILKFIIP